MGLLPVSRTCLVVTLALLSDCARCMCVHVWCGVCVYVCACVYMCMCVYVCMCVWCVRLPGVEADRAK